MEEEHKTFFSDLISNRKPYVDKREEVSEEEEESKEEE